MSAELMKLKFVNHTPVRLWHRLSLNLLYEFLNFLPRRPHKTTFGIQEITNIEIFSGLFYFC